MHFSQNQLVLILNLNYGEKLIKQLVIGNVASTYDYDPAKNLNFGI